MAAQKYICVTEIGLRAPGVGGPTAWDPGLHGSVGRGVTGCWSSMEETSVLSASREQLPRRDLLLGAGGAQDQCLDLLPGSRGAESRVERPASGGPVGVLIGSRDWPAPALSACGLAGVPSWKCFPCPISTQGRVDFIAAPGGLAGPPGSHSGGELLQPAGSHLPLGRNRSWRFH